MECRLQVCIDNTSNWYSMNKLCIDNKKSNFMVIGSKWQSKSLNLEDFTISVDSYILLLAKQAKYLCLWVRNDLSWDDHILELCRKIYHYFYMYRRFTMYVDKHGYDARSAENVDLYIPRCSKEFCKRSVCLRVVHCGISCPRGSKNLRF